MIVGARSGPPLPRRVLHRWRTVGRSHGGKEGSSFLAALCELNLVVVPAFAGVRKAARDKSLVGVPLDGTGRDAGELSPLVVGVPRPFVFPRPDSEVAGRILSRWV